MPAPSPAARSKRSPASASWRLSPNIKGAEIAFEVGVHVMNYVLSVSKTHNEANVRRSREQSIADFAEIVKIRNADPKLKDIKIGCGLATALGCTLEGDVPEAEVLNVLEADPGRRRRRSAAARHRRLCAPHPGPFAVQEGDRRWPATFRSSPISMTRAVSASPTSMPSLEAGAKHFDASLAGLGGCPFAPGATGNIVMEDLVFLLESEGLRTGIDIEKLRAAREIVEASLPGEPKHGRILKAGLPKGFKPASNLMAAE